MSRPTMIMCKLNTYAPLMVKIVPCTGVDYQNSDKAPRGWMELLCVIFNSDEVFETKALPDLHDRFRLPITLEKGSMELTPDRCKTVMTDYKKKVMNTIAKYNLSGNGSDMAVVEHDQDGEGGALESEETYGRFKQDLAIKRAQRSGREDLLIINGDDRREFLGPYGPEVLYWWEMMDANNLLYFFAGKLDKNNRAACGETPVATARGGGGSGGNGSSEPPTKKNKASREAIQNGDERKCCKDAEVGCCWSLSADSYST
eukprot:scaffold45715_cov37-Cyclotella_meneghiniana.AAC.3